MFCHNVSHGIRDSDWKDQIFGRSNTACSDLININCSMNPSLTFETSLDYVHSAVSQPDYRMEFLLVLFMINL